MGVISMQVMAQQNTINEAVHIIPEPVSLQVNAGYFHLNRDTRIIYTTKQASGIAAIMKGMLDEPTGFHLTVKNENTETADNVIILRLNTRPNTKLGDAGYTLKVLPDKVLIAANKSRGLFYGMQTLMQLFPPDIESKTVRKAVKWQIPSVNILDYPRFGWRGLMLDVSRHFFSKQFVEAYIDEMAKYKFNVFHWHLADDQGWRIEIKGLPKLTEVGAWRVPRTGRWGTFKGPQPGEKATAGGYYTQEDIREIVAYAQKRFVTIVPEIDVPAHSLALIASYPNLSCTKQQYSVTPQYAPGGVDNVLCVADDSTWLILDKIFTQVAALFPGEYIHVGGDEANRSFWTKDPKDQALMKKEGIKTPAELQSYFEKKLEKIIISKGKKMIGWDEILEGGLAPEAAVMSWRGIEGGIKAAKMGHHVVMTPTGNCYLDYCQGDPLVEPAAGGRLTLSTCYKFEPVPDGVDAKYILGGQGNLWTENVPNGRHAEYMTWPRSLALSEVFWSPKNKRSWPDFVRRMDARLKYMDISKVKYARSAYDAVISGVKNADGKLKVKLATEIPGLDIYYTFDGTNPDNFYSKYEGTALSIPKGATEIRVITYRDGKPIGRQINCPLTEVAKRIQK
ncbi:MAG TPA: family 20 glycosylhydrolase [Chitinophagaceae bacterium]|nr:family 20 glycosylhydrolase [Chitinophagaceae bacterium]